MTIIFESLGGGPTETTGSLSVRVRPLPRFYSEALEPGNGRLHIEVRPSFLSEGGEDTPPPAFGALSIVARFGAILRGNTTDLGTLSIKVPASARFYEAASHMSIVARPGARLTEAPPPPLPPEYDIQMMPDYLSLADSFSSVETAVIRSRLELSTLLKSKFEGTRVLRDSVDFGSALAGIYLMLLQSSVGFGASLASTKTAMEHMTDALVLGGVVSTEAEAHVLIADALVLGVLLRSHNSVLMQDEVAFSLALDEAAIAVQRMLDLLAVGAEQTATMTLVVLMEDSVVLGDAMTHAAIMSQQLRDGLGFMLRMSVDDGEHVAYALNTETKGLSRYTNYPFNSFMKIGGEYFGVMDTGVYKLDGPDDDGDPIAARIRLGLSRFGAGQEKHIGAMYLGFRTDGSMMVKVVRSAIADGLREAFCYRITPRVADDTIREGQVPVGRGLKSVYFDFILENMDGADFDLDSVEILPLTTTRRIRGDSRGR